MGHSKKCGCLFLIAGAVILTFSFPEECSVSITNTVKKRVFPSQDPSDAFLKILSQIMTAEYNQ